MSLAKSGTVSSTSVSSGRSFSADGIAAIPLSPAESNPVASASQPLKDHDPTHRFKLFMLLIFALRDAGFSRPPDFAAYGWAVRDSGMDCWDCHWNKQRHRDDRGRI